jgi:endonuclease YncB( thermonuclease family)
MSIHQILSLKVIDGDTLEAIYELDTIEGIYVHRGLRLTGIDTPEKNTQAGRLVKQFVESWVKQNRQDLQIMTVSSDKFNGRTVGDIIRIVSNKMVDSLSGLLIHKGLAKPYNGRTAKIPWTPQELDRICEQLNKTVTTQNYELFEWIPCIDPKPLIVK